MLRFLTLAVSLCVSTLVLANTNFEQQAGNSASANAEDTFQQLISQCDNIDVLLLRAKIRLEIGRQPPELAESTTNAMNEGLAVCGEGQVDQAVEMLTVALADAKDATTQQYGTDASVSEENKRRTAEMLAQTAKGDAQETAAQLAAETGGEASDNTLTYVIIAAVVLVIGYLVFGRKRRDDDDDD